LRGARRDSAGRDDLADTPSTGRGSVLAGFLANQLLLFLVLGEDSNEILGNRFVEL